MPKISVIIPALNEEKYIAYPLLGLARQSFKDFETIVVDGGSKDRTREIARKYHAKVITEHRPGIGLARNSGAKVSKGRILVFLDGDTKPGKHLLMDYYEAMSGDAIAATGPIYPLEKTNKRISIGYKIVSIVMVKLSIKLGMPSVVGSNFVVRKDVFLKVKGFNSKLMTYEDWDLSIRLKKYGRIKFVDSAYVHTSARRVAAWGIIKYFTYHVGNMIRYTFTKTAKSDYGYIR
jgi:glycosyltransferase involved in cell wall biosynthesis